MIKKLMAVVMVFSFASATPEYPKEFEQLACSEEVKKKKKKGKKIIKKGSKKKKGFFSKVFGSK